MVGSSGSYLKIETTLACLKGAGKKLVGRMRFQIKERQDD